MIGLDRAGPVGSRSQPQDVAFAPDVEELALARGIEADRRCARLHGAHIPIEQGDIARAERVTQALERGRPAFELRRGVVDRIERLGKSRFFHPRSPVSRLIRMAKTTR
jgi:hypothetical protein